MALDTGNLCILTGNANPDLAKKIADHIGVNLCDAYVGHFNNGETQVMISESIRGKDIFIIQPTSYPVNDNLMELLIMADACKRASAHSITAVVPYYAYARQDRKTRGREPISAKLVANLMTTAGVTRVVTVDLHAGRSRASSTSQSITWQLLRSSRITSAPRSLTMSSSSRRTSRCHARAHPRRPPAGSNRHHREAPSETGLR